jgi:Domain of unknown function (DUF309)
VIPTLPLTLRNRLAATILAAVHDTDARRTLAALARDPQTWLGDEERHCATLLAARASQASEALAARAPSNERGLDAIVDVAATLYAAGLHFEVHEWLEPHWAEASGHTREALQGLIQAAVGWQHLANDNLAGARSLLTESAARLWGQRLGARDFDAFARATAEAAARVPSATPPAFPERSLETRHGREESV